MGSGMWIYWAQYKPDINEVLQEARRAVFEAGEYFLAPNPLTDEDLIDIDNPPADIYPEHLNWLRWIHSIGEKPRTIEELHAWNGPTGEGTQSILDIVEVGTELFYGNMTCPVPED